MDRNLLNNKIKIESVTEDDKDVLGNLLSLYLHDLSEFREDMEISDKGTFEFDSLDEYFENEKLHPFIIKCEDKLAGFILLSEPPYVKPGCNFCIQEFFILRKFRRKGLGKSVMDIVFHMFKGRYCLIVMESNRLALQFWRRFLECSGITYDEGKVMIDGYEGCLYQEFSV